jgi:hypothetical protein
LPGKTFAEDICTFDDSRPEDHLEPQEGHLLGPQLPQEVRDTIWGLRQQILDGTLTIENKVDE